MARSVDLAARRGLPADWVRATEEAIAGLKAAHPAELAAVRGIGLSGQMHGATLLDVDDRVLGRGAEFRFHRIAQDADGQVRGWVNVNDRAVHRVMIDVYLDPALVAGEVDGAEHPEQLLAQVTEPVDQSLLLELARVVEQATAGFEAWDYTKALEVTEAFFCNSEPGAGLMRIALLRSI